MKLGARVFFAAGLVALLLASIAVAAFAPSGEDFRISNAGADGDTDIVSAAPDVAFNATANEYLAVWDDNREETTEEEFEVWGQRLGASGNQVGSDFPISDVGDEDGEGFDAVVAHNPEDDEYLVVWSADALATDGEFEIWGQRLDGDGSKLGGNFRISNVGADTVATAEVSDPDVAYSPAANTYLVAWQGENAGENDFEIYGQMVSSAGAEVGSDFPISNVGAGSVRGAFTPAVAFNPASGEFLVVWEGEGGVVDEEYEIWGQRVNGAGLEQGVDFQISNMDAPATPDAFAAALTTDPDTGEMLVVWQSGDPEIDSVEVYGQRLGAAGGELGKDFKISNALDFDPGSDAGAAAVSSSSKSDEYLVAWLSNATADGHIEVFGQRLGPSGGELGSDFPISGAGGAGPGREVSTEDPPNLAHDPAADRFLAVWWADELATDDEFEVFGRLIGESADPASTGAGQGGGATTVVKTPPPPRCRGQVATKFGTTKRDVIIGTAKRDVIVGLGGKDTLRGLGGNDLLCGGKGKDTLIGGGGKDRLLGEAGKDKLRGGPGKDLLNGGAGKDDQKQ